MAVRRPFRAEGFARLFGPAGTGPHLPDIRKLGTVATLGEACSLATMDVRRGLHPGARVFRADTLSTVLVVADLAARPDGGRSIVVAGNPEAFDAVRGYLDVADGDRAVYDHEWQRDKTPLGVYTTLGIRFCRLCGCTDERACPGGCSWVSAGICSSHPDVIG